MLSTCRWFGILAGILALAFVAACDEDDVVPVTPPPIEVRNFFPADGVNLAPLPGEKFTLSVNFNRAPESDSVRFRLFPSPASAGDYGPTGTGRNWAWSDVELVTEAGAYAWLIDGRQQSRPVVVRLITGTRNQAIGFQGGVASLDTTRANPRGALVFALDPFAPFNPLDPRGFVDLDPLWATVVGGEFDKDGFLPYVVTHQADLDSFLVVAVLDSDGDTVYDPATDWWGYRREGLSTNPEVITAAPSVSVERRADVDITLVPPFEGTAP